MTKSPAPRTSRKSRKIPLGVRLAAAIYVFLTRTGLGRLILVCLIGFAVVSLQMLIFQHNYPLFVRLIGVECLLALLIAWIIFMMHGVAPDDPA